MSKDGYHIHTRTPTQQMPNITSASSHRSVTSQMNDLAADLNAAGLNCLVSSGMELSRRVAWHTKDLFPAAVLVGGRAPQSVLPSGPVSSSSISERNELRRQLHRLVPRAQFMSKNGHLKVVHVTSSEQAQVIPRASHMIKLA